VFKNAKPGKKQQKTNFSLFISKSLEERKIGTRQEQKTVKIKKRSDFPIVNKKTKKVKKKLLF
jgi:hypothetical protein